MLITILGALFGCLIVVLITGRIIASRIGAKQKLYARENRDVIEAAANTWYLAMREAESAVVLPGSYAAEELSASSLGQAEATVELS
jgi:hypothetical protein